MACSPVQAKTLLLALLALLATGPGAHGARTGQVPAPTCDSAALAARVAGSCAAGLATAPCCEAVLAPLDAGARRGGGLTPCFCSAAAQHRLAVANFTLARVGDLFNACAGRLSSAGTAPFPDACRRHGAAIATKRVGSSPTPSVGAGCDASHLAGDISNSCSNGVSVGCCKPVLAAVDIRGCLCQVEDDREIITSKFSVQEIIKLYQDCGGVRPLKLDMGCEEVQQDITNSSCNTVSPVTYSSLVVSINIATLVIVSVILAIVVCFLLWIIYKLLRLKRQIEVHNSDMVARLMQASNIRVEEVQRGTGRPGQNLIEMDDLMGAVPPVMIPGRQMDANLHGIGGAGAVQNT